MDGIPTDLATMIITTIITKMLSLFTCPVSVTDLDSSAPFSKQAHLYTNEQGQSYSTSH